MWLSYNTIVYKHVPAKFLRRKRNEKLRQKNIYATNLLSLFHIKHLATAHAMKGDQLIAFGPSTSSDFPRAVLYCQFNKIWNKKSIFLFFLSFSSSFPFLFEFFEVFDLKNHNNKVPETNSWLIKALKVTNNLWKPKQQK